MKHLTIAGASLIALYALFSIVQTLVFPFAASLLGGAEAIASVSRMLSYTILITVPAYALFAVGVFNRKIIAAILTGVSAALVIVSMVIAVLMGGVVVGQVPVLLLVINAQRALAVMSYAVALLLCLEGGWRIYGYITSAVVAVFALVNGVITTWALSSASGSIGERMAVMGTASQITGWANALMITVLSIAFICHTAGTIKKPINARSGV